jgi:hypothetical protein
MKKKTIKDPLAQAARLLNENAPEGESLAYINSAEAKMLKDAGGAGEPVNSSGVPSYFLNKLFGGGKAPPSLGKFDVGASAREYVDAMTDTGMQEQMLRNRQRFDKKYQDLQMDLAERAADPMAALAEREAMRAQDFGGQIAERQAVSDISFMNQFGADINQARRASDPFMQAQLEQMNKVATDAYQESQMQDLSPEMRRRADQTTLEALAPRGRGQDNTSIAAMAMSREDYLRDIVNNARGQVQSLGTTAGNFNLATGMDPLMMTRGGSDYTQQGYGARAALFGMPQEQVTRINPDAGVNIGMQEYANKTQFDQANYAAQEQAAAGMASGFMSMVGNIAGGALSGGG